MKKIFTNPPELPSWPDFFSNIVTVNGNGIETIYISGQIGLDADKNLVGSGNFSDQTAQAFKNLAIALESVGAKPADIVKITIFVVNYHPDNLEIIGEAISQYFPEEKPACCVVGVESLALEFLLIEVEGIAVKGIN
ncbi:MAG TPA: RidA family protein [Cyanobacteria bacterium UBA11149]|nr:RidA family protein [Cyanobacteria bacterium UBA11367]HBE56034.1 RidA family protein [Cyanobacteria bacterium UBA11366]HBK63565.1 RidA family protein [Cyanobacteria bacterium UBA11166]HBR73143.1 RidA family protein [Cyanobacteria bacterium UBA11159]HBW89175.1 RidA family protein [Cyanobacteria bacterium UBA11149]HCA94911.1 RidA family protein [Cyanobacteria bacterium UBA9226]